MACLLLARLRIFHCSMHVLDVPAEQPLSIGSTMPMQFAYACHINISQVLSDCLHLHLCPSCVRARSKDSLIRCHQIVFAELQHAYASCASTNSAALTSIPAVIAVAPLANVTVFFVDCSMLAYISNIMQVLSQWLQGLASSLMAAAQ